MINREMIVIVNGKKIKTQSGVRIVSAACDLTIRPDSKAEGVGDPEDIIVLNTNRRMVISPGSGYSITMRNEKS